MNTNKTNEHSYDKFLSDSSDDYPKYSDGILKEETKPKEIIGDDYPTYEDFVNEYKSSQNSNPKGKQQNHEKQ